MVISISALKGFLLEEALAKLLENSGYNLITKDVLNNPELYPKFISQGNGLKKNTGLIFIFYKECLLEILPIFEFKKLSEEKNIVKEFLHFKYQIKNWSVSHLRY